jgi:hypothetical protein
VDRDAHGAAVPFPDGPPAVPRSGDAAGLAAGRRRPSGHIVGNEGGRGNRNVPHGIGKTARPVNRPTLLRFHQSAVEAIVGAGVARD